MTFVRGYSAAVAGAASFAVAVAGGCLWLFAIPASAADPLAGRAKASACTPCHGESGISVQPDAPNLAGQPVIYLSEQLRQFKNGKRQSEVMAVIARPLNDQDIEDLAAWYGSIRIQVNTR